MSSGRPRLKIACPSCGQKMDLGELEPFSRISCPRCGSGIIVPRPFGSLMLEEPIGSGRSADVYRALDRTLDREVAVKILNPVLLTSSDVSEAFLATARRSALLNNPAVIPIFSCGEEEGKPFIVMQYMSGKSLADRLGAPETPVLRSVLRHMLTATKGLQAAQKQGLLHLDVKPSNLLLDGEDNLKIGDFGLLQGKTADALVIKNGSGGSAVETIAYTAPERLRSGACTVEGDIFSLGATIYHLVSGQLPVVGEALASFTAERCAGTPLRPLSERSSDVPPGLSDLVADMMAPDPRARPSSYDNIAERLQQSLSAVIAGSQSGRSGAGMRIGTNARLLSGNGEARGPTAASAGRENSRSSGVLNAMLVCSLVLLAALVWRFFGGGNGRAPDTTIGGRGGAAAGQQILSSQDGAALVGGIPVLQLREIHRQRPRPGGLDFAAMKDELRDYLQELPHAELMLERERLGYISGSRDYLITLMRHLPYGGGAVAAVSLADGSTYDGTVPYCNNKGVAIRSSKRVGELITVPWDGIAFVQLVQFFAFYIDVRSQQGGSAGGTNLTGDQRREIAEDCLRLALLCDWYGRDADATRYAAEAAKYDASQEGRLRRLLPANHRFGR